jgi:hypothetical protein
MDYTRAEIIDKVKQLINERTKQWKRKHLIII